MYIIAGKYKNRKIKFPKGQETRPTTSKLREALFNICQNYIENASFLDVFAGSGAMGIEALSRGAKKAAFIDDNPDCIRCIRENLQILSLEAHGQPLQGEALMMIKKLDKQSESFNIVYMDPPYGVKDLPIRLIKMVDESNILLSGGMLFIEENKAALIEREGWLTLRLKSARRMGSSQLLQFEKI